MEQGQLTRRASPLRGLVDFVLRETNTRDVGQAERVLRKHFEGSANHEALVVRMEGLMTRMEAKIEKLRADYAEMRRANDRLTQRCGEVTSARNLLRMTVEILEEQVAEAQATVANAERNASMYKDFYEIESRRCVVLEERVGALKREVEEYTDAENFFRCAICLGARADTVLLPCHHANFCRSCVAGLYATQAANRCPLCRTGIESFIPFNV
jgi:chromosome segregation ATPase